MRDFIGKLMICMALVVLPITSLQACSTLQDPAKVEGALPSEANNLRIIGAGLIIESANKTIGQQLDAGLITSGEAIRLRALTSQARVARQAAIDAVPLLDGTVNERLVALNAILLRILAEQVVKKGLPQ